LLNFLDNLTRVVTPAVPLEIVVHVLECVVALLRTFVPSKTLPIRAQEVIGSHWIIFGQGYLDAVLHLRLSVSALEQGQQGDAALVVLGA
jgi:hypothetical protein